jgi:hypothetical protein
MWLLILEMLVALVLLIGIVWWVMFSGRRRGERAHPLGETSTAARPGDAPGHAASDLAPGPPPPPPASPGSGGVEGGEPPHRAGGR